jgi:hypothetical protein
MRLDQLLGANGHWWVPKTYRKKWQAGRDMIALSWELTRLRGDQAAAKIWFDDLELDPLAVAESLLGSAENAGRAWDDGGAW